MTKFVKPAFFACLATCCLAVASDAQQQPPIPPQPPKPGVFAPDRPGGLGLIQQDGDDNERQALITLAYSRHDASNALTIQIAKQLVDAKTDAEKEKLKEKLKETLNKQFDDRQKRHEKEIEALEAQVKKLKEMVSKRAESKKEIIEDRTRQLEREAKGLGW